MRARQIIRAILPDPRYVQPFDLARDLMAIATATWCVLSLATGDWGTAGVMFAAAVFLVWRAFPFAT